MKEILDIVIEEYWKEEEVDGEGRRKRERERNRGLGDDEHTHRQKILNNIKKTKYICNLIVLYILHIHILEDNE